MALRETIAGALTFVERWALLKKLPKFVRPAVPGKVDGRSTTYRDSFNLATRSSDWNAFLSEYALSARAFVRLLDVSPDTTNQPPWIQDLERIDSRLSECRCKFNPDLSIAANIAWPIAKLISQEFFQSRGYRRHDICPIVATSLERGLLQRLSFAATQVAKAEFSGLGEKRNRIERRPSDREQVFANHLEKGTQLLLHSYPALARLWMVQCRNWNQFAREFLSHASTFAENISGEHVIRSLEPDLSDLHEGNRAVMKVRFASGENWYYKPRSGAHELIWFRLLSKINRTGFLPRFKIPRIVSKDSHCWIEAVPTRPFHNHSQAVRYFLRAGALLYLLYRLRGVDFHAENIVADGENPVLIDCETLLHPDTTFPGSAMEITEALARTGMLPMSNGDFDQNQFGGGLSEVGKAQTYRGSLNCPDVANSAVAGFSAMHKFVGRESGGKLLSDTVSCLEQQATRYVHRPSMHYWMMLQQSLAPDMLRDGLKRSMFLHASCWKAPATRRRQEVLALEDADIPNFFGKASKLRRTPSSAELEQGHVFLRRAFS